MPVPRQGDPVEGGRAHQKRRTRAAIVQAAEDLLAEGITPTVARAAQTAQVSRTTAYRYFPTQDSLLLEVAVTADVEDVEALVAGEVDAAGARDRALEVLELFNRHVTEAEVQYRTALRFYLDQWLHQAEAGERAAELREGRRRRWFARSLEPLRGSVPEDAFDRAVTGLSLLSGIESHVILRDVCRLDDDDGRAVVRWAAEALLEATFGPRPA